MIKDWHSQSFNKTLKLMIDSLSSYCEKKSVYPQTCVNGTSCELFCPQLNINTIIKGVTWQKNCTMPGKICYFPKVTKDNEGNYSCIRSFEFGGRIYKKTFLMKLNITLKGIIRSPGIISPTPDEVFAVDIGSSFVINCTAYIFDTFDDIYWVMPRTSRIYSFSQKEEMNRKTESLIFKEVSNEDLSTVFTCILETGNSFPSSVNITLKQNARPSYVAVAIIGSVCPVVLFISVLMSIKYKIHITLFLRDTFRSHYRVSDGKSFDAFIMYYTSEQETEFSEDDRNTLQNMLEDHFGYSLCLFDRDVLPGNAVADAVLESVEQSRAVLLVPAGPNLSSESALLIAVHEALVERQTRLVFIQNKCTEIKGQRAVAPEILQLMDLGHCVTWTGSFEKSSFFWKQLRYYLPRAQQQHKLSLLPHTV